ncbi:MAG: TIGR02147 family protein, partial [Pseudobdellovibrionaceae bacterium]
MTDSLFSAKDLLQTELRSRQKKNHAYSLRSFAQALGVSPSYLSLIFKGERRLTQTKARSIGQKLSWSAVRRKYFATLAEFEATDSNDDKQYLKVELERLNRLSRQTPSLEVDRFATISDWHHSAILAFLTLPKLIKTTEKIAKRLGLSQANCQAALQRLQRLELVTQNEKGEWIPTHHNLEVASTPSLAIRLYHKEVLRKAMVAVETLSFEERVFSNWVFTVDPQYLDKAKKKIQEF